METLCVVSNVLLGEELKYVKLIVTRSYLEKSKEEATRNKKFFREIKNIKLYLNCISYHPHRDSAA